MDNPNLTMEEYVRLEEEKDRKHRKVFDWQTATHGKIRVDDDFYDLRSMEAEFPAIVINGEFAPKDTLQCKSQVKNDYEKVMPSIPSPEPAISCFDDLDFFKDFENEFPAIVYNDAQTSKSDLLTEPILNPQHIDEFDLSDETSLSEYDEEEQNVLYFNDLFPFNIIRSDDLKSEKDKDDNDIDITQSLLDNEITHGSTMLFETNMALPPREHRHRFLRYEGLVYTDSDIEYFESRENHLSDIGWRIDVPVESLGTSIDLLFQHGIIRTPFIRLDLTLRISSTVEYGVSTSIGYGISSSLSNTAYSLKLINTAYPLPLDTAYRSSDKSSFRFSNSKPNIFIYLSPAGSTDNFLGIFSVRMTKVIKVEFEKIMDVKVKDVSLTCDTQLEIFNMEVSRLSRMDDDLFTYEVEVANIPCNSKKNDDSEDDDNDMGYDPSDVAFIEWLRLKNFNYKTMDHYTITTLWIYWIREDDEFELTDDKSSDDMNEVAEVFRIDTNLLDFETPMCKAFNEFNYLLQIDPDLLTKDIEGFKTYEDYKNDWIYEWNKDVPWVDEKPWTNTGVWTKPTPVKHTCKPLNYNIGCSKWPTCSWKDDGYCNGGNLPRTYIIENQLHYQDYEWYEALEDGELKDLALRNKAIMEGFINEDDNESQDEQKRRWNIYTNYDDAYEINHEHNKSEELCEIHELPVCNIKRYMMIKYSFNDDEEYVAVKEDEYDDLTVRRKEAF
ncbi:hypothetical protein Tco_0108961 [Tanacetum coccineum]